MLRAAGSSELRLSRHVPIPLLHLSIFCSRFSRALSSLIFSSDRTRDSMRESCRRVSARIPINSRPYHHSLPAFSISLSLSLSFFPPPHVRELSIDDAVCEELFQLQCFGAPDSPAGFALLFTEFFVSEYFCPYFARLRMSQRLFLRDR